MHITWEELYQKALEQKEKLEEPLTLGETVVCAIEGGDGNIYTGFNVASCCGSSICAEKATAMNLYFRTGQGEVRKVLVIAEKSGKDYRPCKDCIDYYLTLSKKNQETEFMADYENKVVIPWRELIPKR